MSYTTLLLEIYCGYNYRKDKMASIPCVCLNGVNETGYHCVGECPFVSYSHCVNSIAYANENGEIRGKGSWIGFGEEMEPKEYNEEMHKVLMAEWERICKKKIQEAYDEYMQIKNKITRHEG